MATQACHWAFFLLLLATACGRPQPEAGPFEQIEEQTWRRVNSSHSGEDGLFVQATFHTLAYELSRLYAQAEKGALTQEQLTSRVRQFIYTYIDGRYAPEDGTDINSLYLQYLIYVNPAFDVANSIHKAQFDVWRGEYVRRLLSIIYDFKYPLLRSYYDERWGDTLYSRLVFSIYLKNENHPPPAPYVADLGEHTFLIDEEGQRYSPSGVAGPYPYESDRPASDYVEDQIVYRLYFPNRKADRHTPILSSSSTKVHLVIEGLAGVDERRLSWDLPFDYPEVPYRKLRPPVTTPGQ